MSILIKPIITEKMTTITEKLSRYGFVVDTKVNKIQIKKAVEEMYGVNVIAVNTSNYSGKFKSRNTKKGLVTGKTNSLKKAFVTLAKGEMIDFYSNI
jgi:large subunit ribosomal protein L23